MNQFEQPIVKIQSLSRLFGDKKALDDVNIEVRAGQVFGIVGENGAGKTTLIKHILGLYKAQQGSVSVFGMDPVKNPKQVLSRIGYLSEEPDLPDWMTTSQFMNYMAAFYPDWDTQYADRLIQMFDVDSKKKIRELSKGQKARVGLCAAQAHKPDLLLLDEPSSGLDPIVRKEILSAVIRTVVDEGRSVILSSHFLEEVEKVCDHLLMFSQGKVLLSDPMDNILEKHYRLNVRWNLENTDNSSAMQLIPGVFKTQQTQNEWQLYCFADLELILSTLKQQGAEILDYQGMTLNEIFMAHSPESKNLLEAA